MKRTKRKLKTIALGVLVAAGVLLPCAASAQSDGFFRSGGSQTRETATATGSSGELFAVGIEGTGSTEGWSTGGSGSGGTEPYQNAPLGSGLVLLTALGAGYAVLRRRKNSL